jgi:predicted dinucleotide-binding enzyme
MKIGIVGAGKIGGLLGTLWSRAGHDVMFASRHPESLADLVKAANCGHLPVAILLSSGPRFTP